MLINPGTAVPAAQSTRSRAVVVLGVGRSGTSAITRGLGALGVELGDKLRGATMLKNPTGFYEDTDLLRINKRLKGILGVRGESVRLLEPDWWKQPAVEQLRADAVAIVRQRFGSCPLWAINTRAPCASCRSGPPCSKPPTSTPATSWRSAIR
jgi:hypothetical protein